MFSGKYNKQTTVGHTQEETQDTHWIGFMLHMHNEHKCWEHPLSRICLRPSMLFDFRFLW